LSSQKGKKIIFDFAQKLQRITFFASFQIKFLLLKRLLQHRGRLDIKIKENAEKIFYFFFEKIKQ
jgi:hypothetical protein